jgi:hypothetical protein
MPPQQSVALSAADNHVPHLEHIPPELLFQITDRLDPSTLLELALASKTLRTALGPRVHAARLELRAAGTTTAAQVRQLLADSAASTSQATGAWASIGLPPAPRAITETGQPNRIDGLPPSLRDGPLRALADAAVSALTQHGSHGMLIQWTATIGRASDPAVADDLVRHLADSAMTLMPAPGTSPPFMVATGMLWDLSRLHHATLIDRMLTHDPTVIPNPVDLKALARRTSWDDDTGRQLSQFITQASMRTDPQAVAVALVGALQLIPLLRSDQIGRVGREHTRTLQQSMLDEVERVEVNRLQQGPHALGTEIAHIRRQIQARIR